jgi:hypothetical protein
MTLTTPRAISRLAALALLTGALALPALAGSSASSASSDSVSTSVGSSSTSIQTSRPMATTASSKWPKPRPGPARCA